MNKQIQLSSKSPGKHSFLANYSDKKFKLADSTMYSVLNGKRIKTDAEIHDNIKVKRALSYKKLSFSLRKNDLLLKSAKKIENCESKDKNAAFNQLLPLKSKQQLGLQKFKLKPYKIIGQNLDLNTKSGFKKNIINQQELISDILIRRSQSPAKKAVNQKAIRMKTEQEDKQSKSFGLWRQNTQNLNLNNKNTHLITAIVATQKQESLFVEKQKIPGLKFKPQLASRKTPIKQPKNQRTLSGSSIFNESKKSTYLHQHELLQYDDEERRISELYEMRLEKQLPDLPKQWHFYNCLRMNQLSLYRTNLKLSCQSWILIDHLQLKYLRGWHPKQVMEFDISKRLFLAYLVLQMKFQYKIQLKNVKMRVNNSSLRRKMDIASNILLDSQFTLKNNTIMPLENLFIGVMITRKEDLFWHLVYAICSLYRKYNFQAEVQSQQIQNSQIYIQDEHEYLKSLDLIFMQKCRQICEKKNLSETSIQLKIKKHVLIKNDKLVHGLRYDNSVFKEGNEFQYLHIHSSCVDVAILFMECLSHSYFQQVITNPYPQNIISCVVKVQMGYKFWESRPHKWKNEYSMYHNKNFGVFEGRNEESKSLTIISYNPIDKVIIICNDCKLNMCFRDILGVQTWMHETFKRFRKPHPKTQPISIEHFLAPN